MEEEKKKPHRIYNLRFQPVDVKKVFFAAPPTALPLLVDLRDRMPPIYDQGNLGSCTGFAICGAYSFLAKKPLKPSCLFQYYNERLLDGTVGYDAGSSIYQSVQALEKFGVCGEKMWPYDISKFTMQPPQPCYDNAKLNMVTQANQIAVDLQQMKRCLANGYPFVFGIVVFPSFESEEVGRTGIVPNPEANEVSIGAHAMVVVGYDDAKQWFIVRNSWGTSWGGHGGYLFLPYSYLSNTQLCSDLWTIRKTSRN